MISCCAYLQSLLANLKLLNSRTQPARESFNLHGNLQILKHKLTNISLVFDVSKKILSW